MPYNFTGVDAYFHNFTSYINVVGKQIPQFVQVKRSSWSKILHTLVNEKFGFINVFDSISNDPKLSSKLIVGL